MRMSKGESYLALLKTCLSGRVSKCLAGWAHTSRVGDQQHRHREQAWATGAEDLGAVENRRWQFLGEVMENDLVEVLHGLEDEMPEVGSQVVP